jgi:glutamyl-tRNA reductase
MTILAVGLSHKTTPVEFRERLAFDEARLGAALQQLVAQEAVDEAVILSTCNRMEVYVAAKAGPQGAEAVAEFIAGYHGLDGDGRMMLEEHLEVLQSAQAVEHLFKVVSSLESLVLGEAQILGQVREAFMTAQEAGTAGTLLTRLFKQAIEVGREVRSETEIGANSVSVSTAAVNLVNQVFDGVAGLNVMLVGTGQMGRLAAQYLAEKGAGRVLVANRTFAAAQDLAAEIDGKAIPFGSLVDYLSTTDMLISCTAAPGYVIERSMAAAAMKRHRGRPLLMVDIALPRDIDPACGDVRDVFLYDLDDLGLIMDDNLKERENEAAKAEVLVARAVEEFLAWQQENAVVPTIKQMFEKAEGAAAREIDRAAKALATQKGEPLSEEERAVLDAMASSIIKKILHGPTARLRKQAANPDSLRYTEAARFLFGLDTNPMGTAHLCPAHPGQPCSVANGQPCDVTSTRNRCGNA